jgi:hypothetical protein
MAVMGAGMAAAYAQETPEAIANALANDPAVIDTIAAFITGLRK